MTIGDTVVLRGGGPVLTVIRVVRASPDQTVTVAWFDDMDRLCTADFPVDALMTEDDDVDEGDDVAR